MTQRTRRKIDAALKAKIALEALREQAARAFDPGVGRDDESAREREIEKLHAKIGQLTIERDFLARRWDRGMDYLGKLTDRSTSTIVKVALKGRGTTFRTSVWGARLLGC